MGTTYNWNNPAGGAFGVQDNWTPVGVPGTADTAIFDLGSLSYTVSDDGTPGYVLIDSDIVTFTGSIQTVGLSSQFTALEIGGAGAAIFDGGTLYAQAEVMVGDGNGDGTLEFIDGAVGTLSATNNATALDIGYYGASEGAATPSVGNVLVDDSTLTILGGAYVGVFSAGSLAITDGAFVQFISADVGYDSFEVAVNDASVTGIVTVDGGATLDVGVETVIGVNGDGTLAISDGASVTLDGLQVADNGFIDNGDAPDTGIVTVDGTLTTLTLNGEVLIGTEGNGTLAVTDSAYVQILPADGALNELDVGVAAGSSGTIIVNSGATLDLGEYSVFGDVGTGTLLIDGSTTTVSAEDGLEVGLGDQGLVSLTDGATLAVNPDIIGSGEYFIELGVESGASGTLDVSGDAQIVGNGALFVGGEGDGTIAITSGGSVYSDAAAGNVDAALGYNPSGVGIGLIDDGLWFSDQSFSVGYQGSGTLVVQDGGVLQVDGSFLRVARDPGATGTLTVNASTVYAQSAELTVGPAATNTGDGTGGSGTLDIENGASVYVGSADLGSLAGGAGSIYIDDSLLSMTGNLTVGDAGAGTLAMQNGAVLSVGGSDLSIGQDLGGNGLLIIGGSTLQTGALLTVGPDVDSGDGAVGGSGTLELYGVNVSSRASVGSGLIAGLAGGTGSIDVQDNGLTFYGSLTTGAGTSIVTLEDGGGGIGVVGDLVIGGGGTAAGEGVADFSVRDGGQITDFSGITLAALGTLGIDATSFIYNDGANGISLNGGTLDALGSAGFGYNVTIHSALQITGGTTAQPSALIGTAGSDLTISGGITFDGPAVLLLGAAYNPGNAISDFAASDTLDIAGQIYNTASYNVVAQQLTLTEGPDPLVLNIADNGYSAGSFSAYTDGNGGTDVRLGPPPCYLAGTRIATPDGERLVEDLRPGDRVTLAGGGHAPLIWIGERRLDPTAHPRAWEVLPVRIRRDALGAGLPRRDLLLSPDHALLLDGVLVEAKRLVNGRTIIQEAGLRSVHYLHLELARHDVLLAEGVAAESYLDTGNRRAFADAEAPVLHPSFAGPRAAASCAPFATDPDVVRPIWQRLAERAARLGQPSETLPTTADPAVRLRINGRLVAPLHAEQGRLCFALPPGARQIRLVSRVAAPAWCQPWLDDRRTLGMDIARIRLRGQGAVTDLPLDGPHLAEGWWDLEREGNATHRWTNGDAAITLPFSADTLELTAIPLNAYPMSATTPRPAQQVAALAGGG